MSPVAWALLGLAWITLATAIGLRWAAAIHRNETRTRRHPAHDDALDKLRTALKKGDQK